MQQGWTYFRIVALALVCAGLVAGIGWLGDELNVGPGHVPIWDPDGRGFWIAGFVLVLIVAAAYHRLDGVPQTESRGDQSFIDGKYAAELPIRWILPAGTVLSAVLLLGVYRGLTAISIAVVITLVGLLTGTVSRYLMISGQDAVRERARVVYTLVVHGVAFLSLSMIYIHKVRSLFSATAVLIVGVLLLLALTDGEDELFNRRLVYALVGGIMLGQVTWGLNYWQAAGWTGGAVLLVFFYLFGGLILTHLRRSVQPRDVLEYGSVSAVAFGIVVYSLFA